jgi:hypothetical protein
MIILLFASCKKEQYGKCIDKEYTAKEVFKTSGGFQQVNPAKYILFLDLEGNVIEQKTTEKIYFETNIGDLVKIE